MSAFNFWQQWFRSNRRQARRVSSRSRALGRRLERLEARQLLAADLAFDLYRTSVDLTSAGEGTSALIASSQLPTEAAPSVGLLSVSAASADALASVVTAEELAENANIIYVDDSATGANNGTSWADAYTSLQSGISATFNTVGADQIWVAQGVYKPTATGNRSIAFSIPNNVVVLGGFAASPEDPTLRDWQQYTTTLSGDIGFLGASFDNSFNVVRVSGVQAALDGLVIESGNANGAFPFNNGGGIRADGGTSLAISHVVIANSLASRAGGGLFTLGSTVSISDSSLVGNSRSFRWWGAVR